MTLGELRTGEATWYAEANGGGACLYDPSPNDLDIAALNSVDWANSAWCGACVDVKGPSGSVRVRIVDLCPAPCGVGNLDLSAQAFTKIAGDTALGRVAITWQFVACDVTGPVSYKFKDGTHQWWTAVQVRNSRLPVQSLDWSADSGSTWNSTVRMDYNYFLDDGGFGPNPTRVRITAIDGQVLEDDLPAVVAELVSQGHANFN